jgi:SAM-dependent methyltransferase
LGPTKCPRQIVGDLQIESILSPLLFPRMKGPKSGEQWDDGLSPTLHILDVGCGWGRLLGGLLGFPPHLTMEIEWVGCEPTAALLDISRRQVAELEDLLKGQHFKDRLAAVAFATWDELLTSRRSYFDYAYLVNVLHHIQPADIPNVFAAIFSLMKPGGYLVIHDFFFGQPDVGHEYAKYCEDGIFLGPHHVSALFATSTSRTGVYRIMRRGRRPAYYDLFTFVLEFAHDLGKQEPAGDFSFTVDLPSALGVVLDDLRKESQASVHAWRHGHAARIEKAIIDLEASRWATRIGVHDVVFAASRWLNVMQCPAFSLAGE